METPPFFFESMTIKVEPAEEYHSEDEEDDCVNYELSDIKPDISNFPPYHDTEGTVNKTTKTKVKTKKGSEISTNANKPTVLELNDLPYTVDYSNKSPFQCKQCSITFSRLSSLMCHAGVKHGVRLPKGEHVSFRCHVCSKTFPTHGMYVKHCMSHSNPAMQKPIDCPTCDMRFEYLYLLKRHILSSHSDVTPYKCETCGQHFGQKSHLERHSKKHERPERLNCTQCEESFKSVFQLKCHQLKHGSRKQFKCHLCRKAYHFEYHLRNHLRSHKNDDASECTEMSIKHKLAKKICKSSDKEFENSQYVKDNQNEIHIDNDNIKSLHHNLKTDKYCANVVNNNYPNVCKNENFEGTNKDSMDDVEQEIDYYTEHSPIYNGGDFLEVQIDEGSLNNKPFDLNLSKSTVKVSSIDNLNLQEFAVRPEQLLKCHLCPKTFKYMAKLKTHNSIHKTPKNHFCNVCKISFSHKTYLAHHVTLHEAGKPIRCQLCQKSFPLGTKLQDHVDTHFHLKPYECKHCNKTFTYQRSLDVHIKKHIGVKPFVCQLCDKSFVHKSGLQSHSFVHSNIRTHQCDHCKKYFTVKNQVRRHIIRVHSRVRPHPCDECPMSFSEMNLLRRHQTTVHMSEARITCRTCGRIYKNRMRLDQHLSRSIRCGGDVVSTDRQRSREDIFKLQTMGKV